MDKKPPSDRFLKTLLFGFDFLGLAIAFVLAYAIRFKTFDPALAISGPVLVFSALNVFCLYLFSLYQIDPQTPLWQKPLQSLAAVSLAACAIVLVSYLGGAVEFSGLFGRGVLLGAQLFFALWASSHRFFLSKWLRRVSIRSRYLVLGDHDVLSSFLRDLAQSRLAGTFFLLTPDGRDVVPLAPGEDEGGAVALPARVQSEAQAAVATDFPSSVAMPRSASTVPAEKLGVLQIETLGAWDRFESLVTQPWSGIIVAASHRLENSTFDRLMEARLKGVQVHDLADFYERTFYKVPVFYLQNSWFALSQGFQLLHNPVGLRVKRILDVTLALILLALTAPILAVTTILIKLESRGPILFRQTRVGENGREFKVIKLRSMRVDAEKNGAQWARKNDSRVTRVGALIRATRIDELPQLFNVLRGEMSFIGPRPERPEFTGLLEEQIPFYSLRHILKPGVTGWAQVMYPYGASVDDAREKLQFELYYIKNYSLLLDAAIVFKTIRVVLFGQGR